MIPVKPAPSEEFPESLESLDHRALVEIIYGLRAMVGELQRTNAELREANASLEAQVNELRQRLDQNSTNSNMPPSSDSPAAKHKHKRKDKDKKVEKDKQGARKRKRGGQPGHRGKTRALLPTEEVDEVNPIRPDECKHCGCADLIETDENPRRHQVWDIEITARVCEHQLYSGECQQCGGITCAELPEDVPKSSFTPRVQAIVSMMTGAYRLSKRMAERFVEEVLSLPVSLGSISNMEGAVSESLREPFEETKRYVEEQPIANADETSFNQENGKGWLWVAVTSLVTVFLMRLSRATESAKALLGNFKGYLGTDRFGSYNWIDLLRRQFCWSHLKRDFTKLVEAGGYAKIVGEALQERRLLLFKLWYRVRDGTLKRSSFKVYVSRLRKEIRILLENGILCENQKLSGMCRKILTMEPAMWTFVRIEGVEPTNNAAERALRHGVIWRKICYGTQSDRGSRFVERILTVVETCRQQGRNVLEYLTFAREAAARNKPAPSLLPGK